MAQSARTKSRHCNKKAITTTLFVMAIHLSGCYHLQLARSPLPVVYHEPTAIQPQMETAKPTHQDPKNKQVGSKIQQTYRYILENWF